MGLKTRASDEFVSVLKRLVSLLPRMSDADKDCVFQFVELAQLPERPLDQERTSMAQIITAPTKRSKKIMPFGSFVLANLDHRIMDMNTYPVLDPRSPLSGRVNSG
jgi:hypothetical protein